MRIDVRAWVIAAGVALPGGNAAGQTTALPHDAPTQQPARSACFRGTTRERCTWFPVIEFGLAAGPATGTRRPPFNAVWDLGVVRNVGARTAVGGSITVIVDDEDRTMVGVRPRFRHWLGSRTSLDVAPAMLLATTSPAGAQRPALPGLSIFTGVGLGDLVAVTAQLEVLRLDGDASTDATALFGLRLGSFAGLVAAPGAAILTAWVRRIGN